jgi:hypothetical protein
VRTDRAANVARHHEVWAAVAAALGHAPPAAAGLPAPVPTSVATTDVVARGASPAR